MSRGPSSGSVQTLIHRDWSGGKAKKLRLVTWQGKKEGECVELPAIGGLAVDFFHSLGSVTSPRFIPLSSEMAGS